MILTLILRPIPKKVNLVHHSSSLRTPLGKHHVESLFEEPYRSILKWRNLWTAPYGKVTCFEGCWACSSACLWGLSYIILRNKWPYFNYFLIYMRWQKSGQIKNENGKCLKWMHEFIITYIFFISLSKQPTNTVGADCFCAWHLGL